MENRGGAGRSAFRIFTGLRNNGYTSKLMVTKQFSTDPDVVEIGSSMMWKPIDKIAKSVSDKLGWANRYIPSSRTVTRHPWYRDSSLVHLYDIYFGFGQNMIRDMALSKPAIWRLSNQWPFTGNCAFSGACDRWRTGCGSCPSLDTTPPLQRDTTAELWKQKRYLYRGRSLTIVAPSTWVQKQAQESPLLGDFPVHYIPNSVDLQTFRPIDKPITRATLGLPQDLTLIGCHGSPNDASRKGGKELLGTLARLRDVHGIGADMIALVSVGGDKGEDRVEGYRHFAMGMIEDDTMLSSIYGAADLHILVPLADNLPNQILENIACGTPVFSWDVGGISDAVRTDVTGSLSPFGDIDHLAESISTAIHTPRRLETLRASSRAMAEAELPVQLEIDRYMALHDTILNP